LKRRSHAAGLRVDGGPDLLRHACLLGLEGIVSKHKDQPYRPGRSKHWIKGW
jgi:ATP-dependent DNA ligase